eukprot:11219716-Lingulodinium_polyedra.AAC.1
MAYTSAGAQFCTTAKQAQQYFPVLGTTGENDGQTIPASQPHGRLRRGNSLRRPTAGRRGDKTGVG